MIWWYCCCTHKDVVMLFLWCPLTYVSFLFSFPFFPTHPLSLSISLFTTHLFLSFFIFFYFLSDWSPSRLAGQGIAPNVMAPLPKRAALEKANGASAMFNTGMLQYQQALASMQFQQQAAFLPSGMAPKATTTSALSTQRRPGSVWPGSCLAGGRLQSSLVVDYLWTVLIKSHCNSFLASEVQTFVSQCSWKAKNASRNLCFVWHCMATRC